LLHALFRQRLALSARCGFDSTLAVENGVSAHVVAASLGHESSATTIQSYVKPEAVAGAQQRRVMNALEGGRLAS